jgi:hypothetical protein
MNNVVKVGAEFNIERFTTTADAIAWVKANTSIAEITPGTFEISSQTT